MYQNLMSHDLDLPISYHKFHFFCNQNLFCKDDNFHYYSFNYLNLRKYPKIIFKYNF